MTRPGLSVAGLAAMLLLLAVAGIAVGASLMPLDRVVTALVGAGDRTDRVIVWTLRLPRVLVAALAGAALGLAGLLMQRATRNPLAAPSVLGVVDGAALGVLVFLWVFSDEANALTVPILWQQPAAMAGALIFATLVFALSRRDRAGPLRFILYGIALAALADALVVLMMISGPVHRAGQALIWLAGSVHQADWRDAAILSTAALLALPPLALLARPLAQLGLDDATASATGLDVPRTRLVGLGLAVLLTAVAVGVAGGIGFVGLVAPHVARRLSGGDLTTHLVATALTGASMVLAADLLVRLAFRPLEVPAGALTALVGVPVLIAILLRSRR